MLWGNYDETYGVIYEVIYDVIYEVIIIKSRALIEPFWDLKI